MAVDAVPSSTKIEPAELLELRALQHEANVTSARSIVQRAAVTLRVAELLAAHQADPGSEIDSMTGEIRPQKR